MLKNDKLLALPLFLYSSSSLRLSAMISMRSFLLSCPKREHPSSQAYIEGSLKVIVRSTSGCPFSRAKYFWESRLQDEPTRHDFRHAIEERLLKHFITLETDVFDLILINFTIIVSGNTMPEIELGDGIGRHKDRERQ